MSATVAVTPIIVTRRLYVGHYRIEIPQLFFRCRSRHTLSLWWRAPVWSECWSMVINLLHFMHCKYAQLTLSKRHQYARALGNHNRQADNRSIEWQLWLRACWLFSTDFILHDDCRCTMASWCVVLSALNLRSLRLTMEFPSVAKVEIEYIQSHWNPPRQCATQWNEPKNTIRLTTVWPIVSSSRRIVMCAPYDHVRSYAPPNALFDYLSSISCFDVIAIVKHFGCGDSYNSIIYSS